MSALTIAPENIDNITRKIASDINDYLAGHADIDLETDYFKIVSDEYDIEVEVFVEDEEIELTVDKYEDFTGYEANTVNVFQSIPRAIEFLKQLATH